MLFSLTLNSVNGIIVKNKQPFRRVEGIFRIIIKPCFLGHTTVQWIAMKNLDWEIRIHRFLPSVHQTNSHDASTAHESIVDCCEKRGVSVNGTRVVEVTIMVCEVYTGPLMLNALDEFSSPCTSPSQIHIAEYSSQSERRPR